MGVIAREVASTFGDGVFPTRVYLPSGVYEYWDGGWRRWNGETRPRPPVVHADVYDMNGVFLRRVRVS